ncbi:tyrosine-type recombinase/integrase [Sphingobium sp.]|uniref:tyrosine-type recombinase/integrase n=1 Tax=Sphingobium sp. TaxID=1912891 RepID=UPI003BB4FB82
MAKITKTFVDKVAPPAEGYAVHWDDSVKGYGLRVSKEGKRVFIVMGRVLGKSIQFTLGPYGTLTEDAARKRAQKVLQDMREGIDPRAVVKADAAMKVSLQDVLEAYVGRPGKMKASTAAEYRRHVEKTFAKWAPLPIASITRDMVKERHAALVKGGLEGKKAAPASANAAFVTLRILIRFATDEYRQADGTPLIRDNPVDALKHHWAKLGTRTERYIDKRKIGEVWNKLNEMRGTVQGYEALASVDLTIFGLLTGARRDEMATLTWDRVNIDDHDPSNCWWHLDDRKRGDPIWLPLSSQAVALLKSRPRLKLADGTESKWVFPSWGKTGRIQDARAPMEAISEIAGKHLSLHDLRRSFTNYAMRECLIEKFRTDLLTGHKPASDDVTSRSYLDLARLDWLTPEVQKVGDWIEQQAAIAASKNVVPLRAAG